MESQATCPGCGTAFPTGGNLRGMCPKCLLDFAFDDEGGGTGAGGSVHPSDLVQTEPAVEDPELAGDFGPYRIVNEIGRGGMGVVYRARQPGLGRDVAVKVLPRAFARAPEFTARFQREARAMAALSHPNIISVYDFGCIEGRYYFAMELVEGPNLRRLVEGGRLAPARALEIVPQLCDALQYAHGQGVVHRDIKPENILIDAQGRVKIADFGLAKITGKEGTRFRELTRTNTVMGTAHYMAPEQVERPREVDHRADIYSLGVVFYEMLTGELPLGRFEPPSRKVEVSVRLDEVVLKTLEKAPERRYQQASEVKADAARFGSLPATRGRPRAWLKWAAAAGVFGIGLGLVSLNGKAPPPTPVPAPVWRVIPAESVITDVQYATAIVPAATATAQAEPPKDEKSAPNLAGLIARLRAAGPDSIDYWMVVWELRHEDEKRFRSVFEAVHDGDRAQVDAIAKRHAAAERALNDFMTSWQEMWSSDEERKRLDALEKPVRDAGVAIAPAFVRVLETETSVAFGRVTDEPFDSLWTRRYNARDQVKALFALAWLKLPATLPVVATHLESMSLTASMAALGAVEEISGKRFTGPGRMATAESLAAAVKWWKDNRIYFGPIRAR